MGENLVTRATLYARRRDAIALRFVAIPGMFVLVLGFTGDDVVSASASASLPPPDDEIVLVRYHPTFLRWGEIALSETTRVKLPSPRPGDLSSETREFPFAASLSFVLRTREEGPEGSASGGPHVRSEISTVGSLLLAAQIGEGARGWERFRDEWMARLARASPEGYSELIGGFAGNLHSGEDQMGGAFSVVVCPSMAKDGPDRATEVFGKPVKGADGSRQWTGGLTGYTESGRTCSALRDALRYGTPSQVLTSAMSIDRNVEETLRFHWVDHRGGALVSLPDGSSLSRRDPPEGAGSFESISTKEGVSHFETLRTMDETKPKDAEKPSVLIADAAPTRLPRNLTVGSSVLGRWSIRSRALRLGPSFRVESDESQQVFTGIFFTSKRAVPVSDAFQAGVVHDLALLDGTISANAIRKAIRENVLATGVDDAFLVLCSEGQKGEDEAEYCVSRACAAVLNPKEICGELRSVLGD